MNATKKLPPTSPKIDIKNSNLNISSSQLRINSKIPINQNQEVNRWKLKYEDIEKKRKILLTDSIKLSRQNDEISKKYTDLQEKHEQLETELFEKNEEFTKLTTASKNLYRQYETLRNQYDVETGAMSSALKDASQWYKQNKELKRRTLLLDNNDVVDDGNDKISTNADADIENLNRTIKNLSTEVAKLQTEVECLKQSEFVTNEENIRLAEELEKGSECILQLKQQIKSLETENDQIKRVTEILRTDLRQYQEIDECRQNDVVILRKEAKDYKKERDILAHRSTLLMRGISENNMESSFKFLEEIEELKRLQEDQRNAYEKEIDALQEKLETQSNNSHIEILEEKLKLVESELSNALQKLEKTVKELEELKLPPPPPPPPLPINIPTEPPMAPLRIKKRSKIEKIEEISDSNEDISNKTNGTTPGVNEDIINAIKEGKFTLRKTKSQSKREKEGSKTVSELLNILSTLRRAPKKRQSLLLSESSST